MFHHEQVVRDVESDKPIRYNANPKELYEVSGSSGHVAALAVRLDTFPMDKKNTNVFTLERIIPMSWKIFVAIL